MQTSVGGPKIHYRHNGKSWQNWRLQKLANKDDKFTTTFVIHWDSSPFVNEFDEFKARGVHCTKLV
jgi:hypothetical protein